MTDGFDEFFDDEQEIAAEASAEAEQASTAPVSEPAPAPEPAPSPAPASAPAADEDGDAEAPAASRPQRQSPPFWMVLAIAGVSLLLGVVIGYLVGTTVTINESGSGEAQAQSDTAGDSTVEMPEGHPEVELDEDGTATIAGDAAESDAGDTVTDDPLTLANNYFDMGMSAMNSAQTAEDQQKAQDVFKQAIAHYDEYLQDNTSSAAEVDRAICVFYSGEHEQAIADLEAFVERDPSFAPAWANLGMFYESHGDTAKAKKAYQKAIAAASEDDAYGVGDYAEQRLDALSK